MTTQEIIDLPRARELLQAAMETQGRDFVYQDSAGMGCYNVPIDDSWWGNCKLPADSPKRKTACLVGTAMKLSGVVPDMSLCRSGTVYSAFGQYLTENAISYFAAAQLQQDNGKSWGKAFDMAEAWADKQMAGVCDGICHLE